jgi:hypothetical protein
MATGIATIYIFFARLITFGFAIALLCIARRYSNLALAILLFDSAFYAKTIFISGRRQDAAEFVLMIALAFWFQRGWKTPRFAVFLGLLIMLAGILGIGDYRKATLYSRETDWSAVLNIDLTGKWDQLMTEGGGEMRNAVNAIEHVDQSREFNFGLSHWNEIMFAYVPAQFLGREFKDSLFFDIPELFDVNYRLPFIGSTLTGFSDAFASFWYFGCLKFFLISLAMGRIYSLAVRGSTTMQAVYMLSVGPAMLTITHFTNEIVNAWIQMAVFLFLFRSYAKIRPNPGSSLCSRAASLAPG